MPRRLAALLLLAAGLAVAACTSSTTAAPASSAALTLSPGATPAPAPSRLDAVPAPGTVALRPGPFDDRFTVAGTSLRGGTAAATLTITSDVSDVIVLDLQADFYDGAGALLGTGTTTWAPPEVLHTGPPQEEVALSVPADPAYAARVASAVLSVPVLVNE